MVRAWLLFPFPAPICMRPTRGAVCAGVLCAEQLLLGPSSASASGSGTSRRHHHLRDALSARREGPSADHGAFVCPTNVRSLLRCRASTRSCCRVRLIAGRATGALAPRRCPLIDAAFRPGRLRDRGRARQLRPPVGAARIRSGPLSFASSLRSMFGWRSRDSSAATRHRGAEPRRQ